MPAGGARPGAGRKPGKVSAAKKIIGEMAQVHAEAALGTLVQIAASGESEAARVAAANAILDRGYGKPPQALQHSGAVKIEKVVREIVDPAPHTDREEV